MGELSPAFLDAVTRGLISPADLIAQVEGPRHTHKPHNPQSERYVNGLRWIVFDCECGAVLPERRA